ncbi:TspO/MBR family protein [Aureimonas jatrophae]|jgi:translocator protein|uniref:TspO and MBR related proteins n=1 Tax=Aureimonas jatrophae TaxID=1166073 RepID=A0A1H0GKK3_9HYPH|nr:TspO/MBR family protein [Aureimonas jatrophae]MBB3949616.1 tryptophan-rich sensory protein [Aureimonas jatrophae]SDO07394.1 TspO and MBR related proteins [Aureimonas jatrophae]
MRRWLQLIAFLAFSVGGGALIGSLNAPDDWYRHLAKPWFTPPGWLFAPVWTVLYVLIGVAGWRAWRSGSTPLLTAWFIQLGLNFLWPSIFFSAHSPLVALVVIVGLLAAVLVFLVRVKARDRVAFWCFVPYAVWVAFAALLNGSIVWLN